ncbi:MAG: hypothetical protein K0S09_808 [Sphingobacteriaceae bacterium]|jgi:uncharacterized protein (DUF302 family)|nr:hypothetical protein [Sphingobacteriaceae bacterium]
MDQMNYYHTREVSNTFETALTKVKQALADRGFGVITEIDLKEKFREKLNVDFREYRILGACNPKMAYHAIEQEYRIGVLLPCNILVQERTDGKVEVSAVNPMETMSAVQNQNLEAIAGEVSLKLKEAIDSL